MNHNHATDNKVKDFKKSIKRLISYLGVYKLSFVVIILMAIFSTVFSIVGPKILGKATTKLFEGIALKAEGLGSIDFDYIFKIIILLASLYLISALFQYIEYYIMSGISAKISFGLRKQISDKINRVPMSYYDKNNYGDVLSRVVNDVDVINDNLCNGLIEIVSSITMLLGFIVMMLTINVIMTITVFILLPITAYITSFIVKRSQKYFDKNQETIGKLNSHIEESYGGHLIIKAFNQEDNQIKKFKNINNDLYNYGKKSQFLGRITFPIVRFLGNICYVVSAILGGYFVVSGKIAIGDAQAFLQYSRQFLQPIGNAAQVVTVFQSTLAASERIFEFLDEEEDSKVVDPIKLENPKGHVVFENVCFSYDKKKQIIKNLNLDITPGSKVAIVGPTGAGKTTIVNLLLRFYDIDSGKILIDGQDAYKIPKDELRRMFGMVLQDTWLFNGTIKENLSFGNPDASFEDIKKACRIAQADHFIDTLPDTYNLVLNEDSDNIAEGEKQLLTIARALLANPNILILDEATSNVDTRTEILIQKGMNNLIKNKTSFIIAHRLSTIREADLILVMKDGKIIEQGKHQELLDKKGFYYELYNSQFETTLDN